MARRCARDNLVIMNEIYPQELEPDSSAARQLATLRQELEALAATSQEADESRDAIESLLAGLAKVEKQFNRAGKELYRANVQTGERDVLDEHVVALGIQNEQLQQQLLQAHAQTRQSSGASLAKVLLPALDGLDESLAAGDALMQQARPHGFWRRLTSIFTGGASSKPVFIPADAAAAWLQGTALAHSRLLDSLAQRGVTRIESLGQQFDPLLHHAVESVPASAAQPAGTIVEERRCGYRIGENVERYAEVVVAKED